MVQHGLIASVERELRALGGHSSSPGPPPSLCQGPNLSLGPWHHGQALAPTCELTSSVFLPSNHIHLLLYLTCLTHLSVCIQPTECDHCFGCWEILFTCCVSLVASVWGCQRDATEPQTGNRMAWSRWRWEDPSEALLWFRGQLLCQEKQSEVENYKDLGTSQAWLPTLPPNSQQSICLW